MGGCFSSDSENKKVPLQVKGCTDLFWLIVFVLFALGMAVIAVSITFNITLLVPNNNNNNHHKIHLLSVLWYFFFIRFNSVRLRTIIRIITSYDSSLTFLLVASYFDRYNLFNIIYEKIVYASADTNISYDSLVGSLIEVCSNH